MSGQIDTYLNATDTQMSVAHGFWLLCPACAGTQ